MTSQMNRGNIFDEVMPLREAISSLFEQSFLNPAWGAIAGHTLVPGLGLDVYEDHDNYYVVGVLPGVDPNQVQITAQDNMLTIAGTLPSLAPEGKQVVWQELPSGKFQRTLTLPLPFDAGKIEAQYGNGLLHLIAPKAEQARVRKISVQPSQQQLTSGATK